MPRPHMTLDPIPAVPPSCSRCRRLSRAASRRWIGCRQRHHLPGRRAKNVIPTMSGSAAQRDASKETRKLLEDSIREISESCRALRVRD